MVSALAPHLSTYLLRGLPLDVVKGRWASDAFAIYLRRHAKIMAPYMQAKPQLGPTRTYFAS
ncbi:hypothetical protein GGX14DRAFT_372564 [Mycena pura]|uniref:Uncharacterized protein n=1 Tax=Mycena pura TaxID=153505 RepID=A0AAD6V1N0_9AGAR|nr:hypothetical protein GGX14DRAFT_372564 [Mycena pura]